MISTRQYSHRRKRRSSGAAVAVMTRVLCLWDGCARPCRPVSRRRMRQIRKKRRRTAARL